MANTDNTTARFLAEGSDVAIFVEEYKANMRRQVIARAQAEIVKARDEIRARVVERAFRGELWAVEALAMIWVEG